MAKVHCLTVGLGDCTIIQHGSGHISMIDICGGNRPREAEKSEAIKSAERAAKPRGNFAMCQKPTNPLDYIEQNGLTNIFRFILTHPDMDHLDGFDALMDAANITNFWDSGARKTKPDFSGTTYNEDDWDRYVKVRDKKESGVTVVSYLAGAEFCFANKDESGGSGDFTHIAAPNGDLIEEANEAQEFNDASYIIVYRSAGGKIVIAGDAEDEAWDYAMTHHCELVANVGFLLAPHHGRDSDRDWDFLDHLKPRFSLLGCAPSEHLAYSAWSNRDLDYVTQNQAGNVVLELRKDAIDVYIENDLYAAAAGGDTSVTNEQGYYYLKTV